MAQDCLLKASRRTALPLSGPLSHRINSSSSGLRRKESSPVLWQHGSPAQGAAVGGEARMPRPAKRATVGTYNQRESTDKPKTVQQQNWPLLGARLACLHPRNGLLLAPTTRDRQRINPKLHNSKIGSIGTYHKRESTDKPETGPRQTWPLLWARLACLDPRNGLLLAPTTRDSRRINPKLYNSKMSPWCLPVTGNPVLQAALSRPVCAAERGAYPRICLEPGRSPLKLY